MKIAVCMIGQLRTGLEAFPNLRNFFGECFDEIDFYIHTWDINSYRMPFCLHAAATLRPSSKVSEDELNQYKNFYKPKQFVVEDQEAFMQDVDEKYGHGRTGLLVNLWYSYFKANEMKRQYERLHKMRYDVVVKLRPDIIFPVDRKFKDDVEEFLEAQKKDSNVILAMRREEAYTISSSEIADIAASFISDTNDVFGNTDWLPTYFERYVSSKNINILQMKDSRFTPLRDEWKHMDPLICYDGACIYNAAFFDNATYFHTLFPYAYMNERDPNWANTFYSIMDKCFDRVTMEKLERTWVIGRDGKHK